MKRSFAFLIAAVMLLSLFLTGCGGDDAKGVVNVYNWGEYIDESIFAEFQAQTGIKVNYDTYPDNESMYAKLKTGASNYDVIIPSDYMISRLIHEGLLEKLDFSNIPNYSLIGDAYKGLEYDPGNEYSVPYTWGTVGIIYNTAMIDDEITSWSALFNSKYEGQILMFDNPRDSFGIALKYLGHSMNTTDEAELRAAYDLLLAQKAIKQADVMDQIFQKLESGEAAIGPYYAGDFLTMHETNPDLAFCSPQEGTNLFVDAMCVPKGAANKENAELFISFMCGTDIALRNMDATGYASANTEAAEAFAQELDPVYHDVIFPGDAVVAKSEVYVNLPEDVLALYNDLWINLKK